MEKGGLSSDVDKWDAIKDLQIGEKQELVNTLNQNKWIDSNQIDLNNFSVLWRWENWKFLINESIVNTDGNGENYIIVDGKKFYEKWNHQLKYMEIFDEYWMPHFYIWEVKPDGLIEDCECLVVRNDGWIFKWEWNKKGILKDPSNWEYDWSFVDGRPLDIHSKPEFRRKWVYKREDWTIETYVAYSGKMRPQFISWKDNKEKENRSKKRGSVVSIKKELPTWEIEHILHSWKRDTIYEETEGSYIFKSQNWKELRLPKMVEELEDDRYWKTWELRKGADRAKQLANLLNAVEKFVCLHPVSKFVAFWPHLQVKYRDMLLRKTLLKNVEGRIWISAKDLAEWLNDNQNDENQR
jgi:hypothetical protein